MVGIGNPNRIVSDGDIKCVLLADRHHGLSEGIRGLLESEFAAVVMVADETSLLESAARLQPTLVVADATLVGGENFGWLKRLLTRCPGSQVIVLSVHTELTVRQSAFEAGAMGFVCKREIATQLLDAVDEVLAGRRYVPPDVAGRNGGSRH